MTEFFQFLIDNRAKLSEQVLEHIGLTLLSLTLALLIAVPAAIAATRRPRLAPPLLGFAGILQTVPSIALLGFLLPVLGIGLKPAVFALFLYALLPIIRNTYTGIQGIDPAVREAAVGLGMTDRQVLTRIELPLALPVLFAGIRTAAVINVGVATLAAYIGAGGLGEFIFGGIALNNNAMILAGAIPAALLAVFFDQGLARLQRWKSPRRLLWWLIALPLLTTALQAPAWGAGPLKAAFEPEFQGRPDGFPHFTEVYGLPCNTLLLISDLMYEALLQKEVDFIFGYSTDGRIQAYDLKVLMDDRRAFPPYHCAPLVRNTLKEKHPEAVAALERLNGRLPDSTMTRLNYEVNFLHRSPQQVARDFLQQQGLWRPDRRQGGAVVAIGSKIFTEQYILAELFGQLIDGYTDLDVDIRPGLGGTKICFEALRQGEIDLYPEYTGTGLQVLLNADATTVQRLIADPEGVYAYVDRTFAERFALDWLSPLGFNNTYAVMVRSAFSRRYGLNSVTDLGRLAREKKKR